MGAVNKSRVNVLWITDAIMPQAAEALRIKSAHAVSWIDAMSNRLSNNPSVKLAIVSRGRDCRMVNDLVVNNIHYYLLPSNCGEIDYWGGVVESFKPDVVHLYGTESDIGLMWLRNHQDIPTVVSLQGIISEYARHYFAGIGFLTMLKFTTIRDLIRPSCFFSGKLEMLKRSKREIEQIQLARNVEGRSTWDRVYSLNINPNLKYYYCPRLIRSPFYNTRWDINRIKRHTIFVHQGHYPIKGLHFVLQALNMLKRKYPDVQLTISGDNIFNPNVKFGKFFPMGYTKYLRYLVKEFGLESNITFLGRMSANEIAKQISISHTVVIPSAIENAPNSLAESELVGVPTIASFVGGNMDMMTHNVDGFLYCYNEPGMLAEYVSRIFDDDKLALELSKNAHQTAMKRHDPEMLEKMLLSIYKKIE